MGPYSEFHLMSDQAYSNGTFFLFQCEDYCYTYKAILPMDLTFLIIYTLSLTSIENTETRKFNVTFCSIQILPYNY